MVKWGNSGIITHDILQKLESMDYIILLSLLYYNYIRDDVCFFIYLSIESKYCYIFRLHSFNRQAPNLTNHSDFKLVLTN